MKHPKITLILRGYTKEECIKVVEAVEGMEDIFAIEVTFGTPNVVEIIQFLSNRYDKYVQIGAGTIKTIDEARIAIESGAKFLLSPIGFDEEIFTLCKENKIRTIPGAFTPSEIIEQVKMGADIVKVFPMDSLNSNYFKSIQVPLGTLPLMAVGGVSLSNAKRYFESGIEYLGIGSGLLSKKTVSEITVLELKEILKQYKYQVIE